MNQRHLLSSWLLVVRIHCPTGTYSGFSRRTARLSHENEVEMICFGMVKTTIQSLLRARYALLPQALSLQCTVHLSHDTLEAGLEPPDGVVLVDLVVLADLALAPSPLGDAGAGARHAAVEVHAVDADGRVVLDAQVDVFRDAEAEVAGLAEVLAAELVLLDLEATLEDLFGLGASHGDVDGDLFVTTDAERSDGVSGLAVDRSLTRQLFQHLCSTGETIARLADRDVQDELVDAQLPHGVRALVVAFRHREIGLLSDGWV